MGPEALAQVLSPLSAQFDPSNHPDLLVGLGTADDAAVYRINARTAIVSTCDFFAPIVDDPYSYGAIAAANAMSDIFAMGGEVVLALNIAAFPEDLPTGTITTILKGAAEMVAEAGGIVAGGHTVWDEEPKFGLSVLGLANPNRLLTKSGLRPGDTLFLTKPLGTGTILSAARNGDAQELWISAATDSMKQLNRHAMHLALEAKAKAATDITGFGLAGHLWEMAERSEVSITLDAPAIPLMEGATECAAAGYQTGGAGRNNEWVGSALTVSPRVSPEVKGLLFDPQTSGGLVVGVGRRAAVRFLDRSSATGQRVWRIGAVETGPPAIHVNAES